jgi:arylsulfatase A-like enzyme
VRCKRIWKIFEERGEPVGLCGYLVTWPPDVSNGFLIPSLFALGPETQPLQLRFLQEFALSERRSLGTGKYGMKDYMAFASKLRQNGVQISSLWSGLQYLAYRRMKRPPAAERFWRQSLIQPQIYADVFSNLYRQYQPTYAGFHFHLTDTISHKYWQYLFPEEFDGIPEEDVARYGQVIPTAYRTADRILGQFLQLFDQETTIMVLSDHGFQAHDALNSLTTLNIKLVMRLVDMPGYIVPTRIGGKWFLVSKDRQARGIPDRIKESLSSAYIEDTGGPLFGVMEFNDYVRVRLPRQRVDLSGNAVFPGVGTFKLSDLLSYEESRVNSGAHHDDGIVILHGNKVNAGAVIEGRNLLDVAPTLLTLAGLPVARDMDGQVMLEAIDKEFLRVHPVTFVDSYESDQPFVEEEEMTEEEREKVMGRLEALGYL